MGWNLGMHSLLATSIVQDLFTMGVPVLDKVARTVAVYGGMVFLLRLAGRRELAQLNSLDLVVLLLLSNVVQNAVIGPDNSLVGGLLGAAVLVALNALLVRTSARVPLVRGALEGQREVLIEDGQLDERRIRELGLRPEDVVAAIRRHGADEPDQVRLAALSPSGAIEVQLRDQEQNATRADIERVEAKLDRLLAGS